MATTNSPEGKAWQSPRRPASPLAIYRFAKGYSQRALADRAGVCRETVNRIERGRGLPTLATARALAAVLEIAPEALFPPIEGPRS